jgi:hypothetical protein
VGLDPSLRKWGLEKGYVMMDGSKLERGRDNRDNRDNPNIEHSIYFLGDHVCVVTMKMGA